MCARACVARRRRRRRRWRPAFSSLRGSFVLLRSLSLSFTSPLLFSLGHSRDQVSRFLARSHRPYATVNVNHFACDCVPLITVISPFLFRYIGQLIIIIDSNDVTSSFSSWFERMPRFFHADLRVNGFERKTCHFRRPLRTQLCESWGHFVDRPIVACETIPATEQGRNRIGADVFCYVRHGEWLVERKIEWYGWNRLITEGNPYVKHAYYSLSSNLLTNASRISWNFDENLSSIEQLFQ